MDVNKIDFKNDFKLTLIEEEQHYKDLFKMFEKIKNERKDKYLKLKKKEHELCDLLNENSYSVSDGNSYFFSVFYLIFMNYLFLKIRQSLKVCWKTLKITSFV